MGSNQEVSVAFENTTRSLANDINSQAWLLTIIAVLILSAWIAWSFLFPIPIYKSALTGRLEKAAKPVSIIAHRSGYIKHHQINVGQNISAQDILLRFDDNQELLRKRQIHLEIEKLVNQRHWLRSEMAALKAAAVENNQLLQLQQQQAEQDLEHATRQFSLQQQIVVSMDQSGIESQLDLLTQRLRSTELKALVDSLKSSLEQYAIQQRQTRQEQAAQLARLRNQLARLSGEIDEGRQQAAMQQQILDDLDIVAPISGELAEAIALTAGAWITEGSELGTLLPTGDWQFVAYFRPSDVYGHIRTGQVAKIDMDGFPWQQYGSLHGRVTQVDSERRAHQVRVVLQLTAPQPQIPLQHGMPGTVHIQTEEATPWQLLLRAISAPVGR